jgi:uncharacterized protein YpbB
MTKTALKKKIVDCVEHINDENMLQAVYTILNGHVENTHYEISAYDIKMIEEQKRAIMNGTAKTYTAAEVRKKLLKKLRK